MLHLLLQLWHVSLASNKCICVGVVLGVRHLPGLLRDEQERVDDEARDVVLEFSGAEGAVSGFVGYYPAACGGLSGGDGVDYQ